MLISLDTECVGLDVHHGSATPFLVTMASDEGQIFFEWDVDPLTRKPNIPPEDILAVQEILDAADEIALQNAKFDYSVLKTVGVNLDWSKVHDTLIAGHLLGSNLKHDLTSMGVQYLRVDIGPYEAATDKACNEARRIARSEFGGKVMKVTRDKVFQQPRWLIAEEKLPNMPSIKGGSKKGEKGVESERPWKADLWLPRAVARAKNYKLADVEFVDASCREHDGLVGAGRWKCPFSINGTYKTPEAVAARYREWVVLQPELMKSLWLLDGQRMGFDPAEDHHVGVLRELVRERCSHPWWTVARDYANADSALTLPLWKKMRAELEAQKLWKIYLSRMPLPLIGAEMEERGVTANRDEKERVRTKYEEESRRAELICLGIAEDFGAELKLPKSGTNKSLTEFVFGRRVVKEKGPDGKVTEWVEACPGLGLAPTKWTESGAASMDKGVLAEWEDTLEHGSLEHAFIEALQGKRKRDTSLGYLESYEKFWLPMGIFNDRGEQLWFRLHPSLNPTGTDTLRWSSSNPNSQQISKQESECHLCSGNGCRTCDGTGIALWSLRRCFGPAPGREWWSADASNIELRIPAFEAQEPDVMQVFNEPDAPPYYGSHHLLVFDTFWPDIFKKHGKKVKSDFDSTNYQWVKNGTYARQYGAQKAKADATFHFDGATELLANRFPNIDRLGRYYLNQANKLGWVETLPDKTVDPERGYPILCSRSESGGIIPTTPFCYHTSGTACQWMGSAMIECDPQLKEWQRQGFDAFMTLQVHDELVFDMPKRAHPKKNPKASNLGRARVLQRLMESCGVNRIGIPTPVNLEYHETSWAKSEIF